MKRLLLSSVSAVLALTLAAPALALQNETNMAKLSRRLVQSQAMARQRVPGGSVLPVDLLLRIRKEAQKDATGLSDLSRGRITTRVRTIRGGAASDRQYWKVSRPSRRSIIDKAESSLLTLPPAIVETGGARNTLMAKHASRRTVRELTRKANVVKVQAAVNR